jgi:hypothetical protein
MSGRIPRPRQERGHTSGPGLHETGARIALIKAETRLRVAEQAYRQARTAHRAARRSFRGSGR